MLKFLAWWVTGSVGLLSDALESLVNLAGASFALWMILITRRPPDDDHPYGHAKAEYFASGFEGLLILGAAGLIVWSAVGRLVDPLPLQALGIGLALSAVSTVINLATALTLRRAGKRLNSVALQADAHHLMTDVLTSVGVVIALIAVWATGWLILDPLIALLVAAQIAWMGLRLLRVAVDGLMDRSLDEPTQTALKAVLDSFADQGVRWERLRTRRMGTQAWIDVHIRVPGHWTVSKGHERLDQVEAALCEVLPTAAVLTHLEPWIEEAVSDPQASQVGAPGSAQSSFRDSA